VSEQRPDAAAGAGTRLGARDAWLALALAVGSGVLYALTQQTRYFGDGPGLVSLHVLGGGERYYNVLYLPACELVQRALFLEPLDAPRVLSPLALALGLGLAFLNVRRTGTGRPAAVAALALLACTPAVWFYATTPEVHALHFAFVQLVAFVTWNAPWGRPGLALALVALAFPLLYGSHIASVTLGPGWVLLVQLARSRTHSPFRWRTLLLVVGPVLLAALVMAMVAACWLRYGDLSGFWEDQLGDQVELHDVVDEAGVHDQRVTWRDEWLVPMGLLVPLAAAGYPALRRRAWLLPATATLTLVPLGFFLWWNQYERGGYVLASSAFLAVPCAHLFSRARNAWGLVPVALIVLQALLARRVIDAYDQGWVPAERVAMVREAIGESGLLIETVPHAPDIRCVLPGVREINVPRVIRRKYYAAGELLTAPEVVASIWPELERRLANHDRVAVEIGYPRAAREGGSMASMEPTLRALEERLRATHSVRELAQTYLPMLVIEPPPREGTAPDGDPR
jgi:hypothetical protein